MQILRPVAVIADGTRVTGTLSDISNQVEQAGLKSPAMIIVGSVVTLRDKLSWFNSDDN